MERRLGWLLNAARVEKHIAKTVLARGLCTVTALTRYEEGERVPGKFLADALLERLGFEPFRFEFMVSEEEFDLRQRRDRLERLLQWEEYAEAEREAGEFESRLDAKDSLNHQYLWLVRSCLLKREGSLEEREACLKKALECTRCADVPETGMKGRLFSSVELQTLCGLAECRYQQGREQEAFRLYEEIEEYRNQRKWAAGKRSSYHPRILLRLAQKEEQNHNSGKAMEYLNQAEQELITGYRLELLEEVLEMRKRLLERMGMGSEERDGFLTALRMIGRSSHGNMTQEILKEWENTAKPLS